MADDSRARILVTGGNGFLGQAVVGHLMARGRPVRVSLRQPNDTMTPPLETTVVGDLAGPVDWSQAVQDIDCVVHTAGRAHQIANADRDDQAAFQRTNVDAVLELARQAARASVRRLIFISSAHVNGGVTRGKGFRTDDTPQPTSVYARSKLDAEMGLADVAAQTGLQVVVIRPPLITGTGVKGNLATLYKAVRRGLPLPLGKVTDNRRDLVSRETLCDLIDACIDHPAAVGETFMVSDGRPVSTRRLIERMAVEVGVEPRLVPVPVPLLRTLLKAIGRGHMASQLTEDLEIDISHTCERLGWQPPQLPDAPCS